MNIPLGAFKTSHEKKEQTNAKKPLNTDFFAFAMSGVDTLDAASKRRIQINFLKSNP